MQKKCKFIQPNLLDIGNLDWGAFFPPLEKEEEEKPKECICSITQLTTNGCNCGNIIRWSDKEENKKEFGE